MKKIIVLFVFFISISSCDKGFEELNKNPLAPTIVNYEAIFNELVSSLRQGWNRQLFLHNEVLYDLTELGVVTAQTFGNIDAGAEDVWSNYYGALKNARQLKANLDMLAVNDIEAANIVKAQIDILMAYKTFQVIDLFGDIPYSEAGKIFAEEEVIRPAYDEDKEIYLSLLNDLKNASALLINLSSSTQAGNPYLRVSTYDALFNDNLATWVKFSNSLQLKYLLRIFDKEPALVNEEVNHMLTSGYDFINPGEDVVMLPFDQSWSNLGVNWSFREHNRLRMGSTMWNFMTDNSEIKDPRAQIFFETNNTDIWVSFPQISQADTPQSGGAPYDKDTRDNDYTNKGVENIYSSFNFYLVRDEKDIPEILLSAAEVKLLLAEVFLRGIGTPTDLAIASFRYQEGMLTSMTFWQDLALNSSTWENKPTFFGIGELYQVTEDSKYKFDTNDSVENNLAKIYTQRWIDNFRQPWEAFSLMRLTNGLPLEKMNNDFYRFKYPESESSYNLENYTNQVAKMGGDETNIKVWWMD